MKCNIKIAILKEGLIKKERNSIMKTIKLYDDDAYAVEFAGKVLSCEQIEEGYAVILDKTLFFPEEGGQTPDKGDIDGIEVLDVQIKDNIITHTTAQPLEVGKMVQGKIDWQHRFYNMQQHSGEHLFSGLAYRKYGYKNVGFHRHNLIAQMKSHILIAVLAVRKP